jgi:divalent metal cation (Fe/Co/Zn/Cd) transporter
MLSIGLGPVAYKGKKRWFSLYSIGTLVTLIMVGAFTGLSAVQIDAQQATPWLGVTERILVHGSMLWVTVLAIVLLREEKRGQVP